MVRTIFRMIRRGVSIARIVRYLAGRGIVKRSREEGEPGKPFGPVDIRSIALRPVYVGLRVHCPPECPEARSGHCLTHTTPGIWEPIVSDELYYAVRQILDDPTRRKGKPGAPNLLTGGGAKCAECGGDWRTDKFEGRTRYLCREHGCFKIDRDPVDAIATEAILEVLSAPENYAWLQVQDSDEITEARAELEKARAELSELTAQAAAGHLSVAMAVAMEPPKRAAVKRWEERVVELVTPAELTGFITPGGDARDRWAAASSDTRRAIAKRILTPQCRGELRVHRKPSGRVVIPVEERITWYTESSSSNPSAPISAAA